MYPVAPGTLVQASVTDVVVFDDELRSVGGLKGGSCGVTSGPSFGSLVPASFTALTEVEYVLAELSPVNVLVVAGAFTVFDVSVDPVLTFTTYDVAPVTASQPTSMLPGPGSR